MQDLKRAIMHEWIQEVPKRVTDPLRADRVRLLAEWLLEDKLEVNPMDKNDTVTVILKSGRKFFDHVNCFPSEHLIANIILTIRAGAA